MFKLVQALCCKLELGDEYLYYIDLACLGTVADIVELTGENRVIVSTGLKKINRLPNLGIKALLDVAQIKDEIIDAYKLAFIVAPRINAAGRMGDASRAVKLLLLMIFQLKKNWQKFYKTKIICVKNTVGYL